VYVARRFARDLEECVKLGERGNEQEKHIAFLCGEEGRLYIVREVSRTAYVYSFGLDSIDMDLKNVNSEVVAWVKKLVRKHVPPVLVYDAEKEKKRRQWIMLAREAWRER